MPMKTYLKYCLTTVLSLVLLTAEASAYEMNAGQVQAIPADQAPVSSSTTSNNNAVKDNKIIDLLPQSAFKQIEWTELLPKDDLEALLNPPSYVNDVTDGSSDDWITNDLKSTVTPALDDAYQQALVSARIVPEMDGKAVRLPGFIVPIEFDDNQSITQFFFVPFFGACLHLPPPPPNQIIFVDYPEGFQIEALYEPFWVSGVINTASVENDIATAAYTMRMQSFMPYDN